MRRSPIWNFNPYRPKVSPFDKLMIEDVLDITQSINVKANPRWRWFLLSNSKRRLGWESLDEEQASWDAWVLLMTNDQETEGPQQAAPPLGALKTAIMTPHWEWEDTWADIILSWPKSLALSVISHGKTQTKILAKPVFFSISAQQGLWIALGGKKKQWHSL